MREKLNRGDWLFLGVCTVIFAAGLAIGIAYFDDAFPEASIDFRYNRGTSQPIAQGLLEAQKLDLTGYRHAAEFDHDDTSKIFLERELGLEKANQLTGSDVQIWYWRHRWFKPLQIEESHVDVAPGGAIVSFYHRIPEDRAAPSLSAIAERGAAEAFLRRVGVLPERLQFVSRSEQKLPKRTDVTYVWEAKDIRPAGAPYRYQIVMRGDRVGAFSQYLKVPDPWIRSYQELRSKNTAAAWVDQIFLAITVIAALVIFITRMRRGDVHLRFALGTGLIGALLWIVVSLNEFPSALANYNTSTSFPAFLARQILLPILIGVVTGVFLAVIVGSGEALYRERLPNQLAMPRIASRRALTSKRVFKSFILGYTLFAAFLAYQALFYIAARRFGAWAPADIPYTSILNSAFPWAAVLFMGFFPSVSEEFMSRAFSIPFFERFLKSPLMAIILAGFIWGFGHVAYPNQPFYIRGVEVGIAGVVIGALMYRYGLLGLLIWHYTVDALYTAFLLFRSGNPYYIFSAGLASLIFVIPAVAAMVLYRRNGGFVVDDDLSNAAIGTAAAPQVAEEVRAVEPEVTSSVPVTGRALVILALAIAAAVGAFLLSGPSFDDVINYRLSKQDASDLARRHLAGLRIRNLPSRILPLAVPGFRWWNPASRREEGGNPGDYDEAAHQYLLRHADPPVPRILDMQRNKVEAATWMVRMFTPGKKNEIFVEVDPRTSRAVGMHEYLDQDAPGATLEQTAADAIARSELGRYGLRAEDFEIKEALQFQQPGRRDWLFHFQEKTPLAAEAFRRATVRISGDRVTQFAKTIHIPEQARRDFAEEGILNTMLLIAKIVAVISLLGVVIYGVVAAARDNRFAWKPATKVTAFLAIPAIAAVLLNRELLMAQYDTAMPWETFSIVIIVGIIFAVAFQLGMAWLSVAVLETAIPAARRVIGPSGARRFGAAAVVATVTLLSILALYTAIKRALPNLIPRMLRAEALEISELVAIPLPALSVIWQAILTALIASAAVAGIVAAIAATPPNRRFVIYAILFGSILLLTIDSDVTPSQLPLALLIGTVTTAIVWVAVKYILRDNLLAYPVAFFTVALLSGIVTLLPNDRPDLQLNAYALIALGLAVLVWYGTTSLSSRA